MEDKLLFILFYFKVHPLQEVMACFFDTSQGRVHEWIYQLSPVLKLTLGKAQTLPERDPKNLEQTLALTAVNAGIDMLLKFCVKNLKLVRHFKNGLKKLLIALIK
jgi:Helix-turn-helix of DDE superfamily endonuclease